MPTAASRGQRETAGVAASALFMCLASARDVYFAGVFQSVSPLSVAIVAFTLCSLVFLPIALATQRKSLRRLLRRPRELFWVNATSAVAWIAFFYSLRFVEPLLAQILFSGVGPLSVVWVDRYVTGQGRSAALNRRERSTQLGLLASLVVAIVVAVAGLSGAKPLPVSMTALGVALAIGAGVSISMNTVLCHQLNDDGVDPVALVSLRFVGAVLLAAVMASSAGHDFTVLISRSAITLLVPSLVLIVFPIYVNQVAISLASPLTVRVVLAVGPVVIFVLQLADGRFSPSPYSFAAAVLYGVFASLAVLARQRAIRSTATHATR